MGLSPWLISAAAVAGLIIAGMVALIAVAVIRLEDHAIRIEHQVCKLEQQDRSIDHQIVHQAGLRMTVPTAGPCR